MRLELAGDGGGAIVQASLEPAAAKQSEGGQSLLEAQGPPRQPAC